MAKGKRKAEPDNTTGDCDLQNGSRKKKEGSTGDREDKLLGYIMQCLLRGDEAASFRKCSQDMGFMERTTTMRNAWKALIDGGLIEPCTAGSPVYTSDHKLTEAGKEHASTPEYQEYIKDLNFVPTTNEDHQQKLKKKLINKQGVHIFDLLLRHGSLTRRELAGLIGTNDRSHTFSYAHQQLKKKLELIEEDSTSGCKGKLRLSDKAFLPNHRPEIESTPPEEIEKLIDETTNKARSTKKGGPKKKAKKSGEHKESTNEAQLLKLENQTESKEEKHKTLEASNMKMGIVSSEDCSGPKDEKHKTLEATKLRIEVVSSKDCVSLKEEKHKTLEATNMKMEIVSSMNCGDLKEEKHKTPEAPKVKMEIISSQSQCADA